MRTFFLCGRRVVLGGEAWWWWRMMMYGRYCGGEGVLWRRVVQGGARADAAIDRGGPTSVPLANWRPPALPHYTATLPQWRPHLPPLFPLVIMSHLCCGMSHASPGTARISRGCRSPASVIPCQACDPHAPLHMPGACRLALLPITLVTLGSGNHRITPSPLSTAWACWARPPQR